MPELALLPLDLWQAAKKRQGQLTEQHAGMVEAIRTARLNQTHRPKSLLSGLVHCGVCGGPYTLRGQGRFVCSRHLDTRACDNNRSITRAALEQRVLAGLKDRLMAPDLLEEAIRAYVEETNRLNHERRAASAAGQIELRKVVKAIDAIVDLVEEGRHTPAILERLYGLEDRAAELRAQQAAAPSDVPDIHPNIAELYRRKVTRLAETLNDPADRDEAADALRSLIEKVELRPGSQRGEVHAVLHGEIGAILDWLEGRYDNTPGTYVSGVSVSMGAGAGFEPATFRL